MALAHDHFIAGQWQKGAGEELLSTDPGTGHTVYRTRCATADEVTHAVAAARQAFPAWARLPIDTRAQYLQKFCDRLTEQRAEFALHIAQETGKPLWESHTEVSAVLNKLDVSLQAYTERSGHLFQHTDKGELYLDHRPHGVFAVLGPFNFPAHLPNGHIMPALLAGNSVVFKPSELTPLVGAYLFHCWEAAGLPPGVLNLVQGGHETAQALIKESDIAGVLFTGSYATGKLIHQSFAGQPEKMLALEMGGNNPLIIAEVSNIDAAVYHTIQSAFISTGQRCTCARRLIIVEDETTPAFLTKLTAVTKNIRIGHHRDDPEPFMGPLISVAAVERVLHMQARLMAQGATVQVEAQHIKPNTGFISPGILDVTAVSELEDVECFGPFLQVFRCQDFSAALAAANNTQYGLAAGLLSDNIELFEAFRLEIRTGTINWNRPLTGASSRLPFGGIGHSGNLRPSAFYAADYCAYPVAGILVDELQLPEVLTPGVTL